ncbi:MAG TPA: tRNA (N(6)-L-threonylcarbamoyladenosine(37)-C(2))-methylthiotransferase MtaB [Candidatus Acidoferrales bacterium]|nr:tRNA (N(6)-L-threonylcarbamoyladenosine(37)-C(2))-methylthiotransferase MtaB [Candidatus Acidoferrales bacterium]
MVTFSIENFGCRATEADAAALRRGLLGNGLTPAAGHDSADVVVLNTCTVTAAADSQAREAVRKIHRANPGARIVVTGCYAQRAPEELAAMDGVAYVVGNSHQAEIPGVVRGLLAPRAERRDFVPVAHLEDDAMSLARGPAKILTGDIFAQSTVQIAPASFMAGGHTRPILKIQDGCSNRCSYCVIPFVRGRSRSLPPDEVVREVHALTVAGAKEIVLSGINLGSYGRDLTPRAGLAGVVRRILDETEIQQLRLSSIEPQDVTEDFVELVASSDRIAPHFHIPLQSGSDRILRAMHRWYRSEHYAERVKLIRRRLPDAAIGADVIVGFPGETDEDWGDTVGFIESLPFTYLHVFSFSERPGTAAASLGDAVPLKTIREGARALRALAEEKSAAFRAAQAGRVVRALTLARGGDDWTGGLTANYLKVRIAGRHPANEWHEVCLDSDCVAEELRAEPAEISSRK